MKKKATPQMLRLKEGELVKYGSNEYAITKIVDLERVLAKNLDSGKSEVIEIRYLAPYAPEEEEKSGEIKGVDLETIPERDWAIARHTLEIIKPLLRRRERGSAVADKIAEEAGVSRATLYRWLAYYRNTGLLSSLLPAKRGGGQGKSRLSEEVEAVIQDRIENFYLTKQQPSINDTIEEVRRLCFNAKLPLPHAHTIRKRIKAIEERERIVRRRGQRTAEQMFDPVEGTVPDAEWPLAMTQIDHTPLPVMVVDEKTRMEIGKPWVTFGIDVDSRVVQGMYLTLEPPSAMSAGLCLVHAILPKEKWLDELGVKVDWPCWGVMGILHMDNAREFRGDMLKVACDEYNIDLQLRPVKKPRYGGHIERLMGTASQALKKVQGSTISDPKERGDNYDPQADAVMTLHDLEKWLVLFVARYHHRRHGGIGMTPLQKYTEGLLGGNGRPPRGLPARRLDEEKIRLDFMPFVERTIQPYGVVIDDIYYFSDVLRRWINAPDPENPKASRVFRFKRDPRDISQLYFFGPDSRRYFAISYRDLGKPPISLYELRGARKAAKDAGYKEIDEQIIFEFVNKMRDIEDKAAEKTRKARRDQQRRANNEKARKKTKKELAKTIATAEPAMPTEIPGYNPDPDSFFEED